MFFLLKNGKANEAFAKRSPEIECGNKLAGVEVKIVSE